MGVGGLNYALTRISLKSLFPLQNKHRHLHLMTACTVVKSRGLFRTSDVKMNSKRVNLTFFDPLVFGLGTFVMTYRPWTFPLSLERTVFMLIEVMQLDPILRLVLGLLC